MAGSTPNLLFETWEATDAKLSTWQGYNNNLNKADGEIANLKAGTSPDASQVSISRTLTIGMVSSGVDYKVFFDVETKDVRLEFASSIFTPEASGYYLIACYATFNAVASGNSYVKIYKGGSYSTVIGGATDQQIISVCRPIYLLAGQQYEFYVAQNSGASQTITSFSADIVKLT